MHSRYITERRVQARSRYILIGCGGLEWIDIRQGPKSSPARGRWHAAGMTEGEVRVALRYRRRSRPPPPSPPSAAPPPPGGGGLTCVEVWSVPLPVGSQMAQRLHDKCRTPDDCPTPRAPCYARTMPRALTRRDPMPPEWKRSPWIVSRKVFMLSTSRPHPPNPPHKPAQYPRSTAHTAAVSALPCPPPTAESTRSSASTDPPPSPPAP